MIARLLEMRSERITLFHVRMAFSEDIESVGKFALRKLWVLFTTVLRIWWARLRYRTDVLYYPPSGPSKIPVLRDIVLLCSTRWLFRKVVFHFHAGGVSEYADRLPIALRYLFRLAYRKPSLAIRTAPQNPDDGKALGAARDVVVPNGLPDMRGTVPERVAAQGEPITVLFTGLLVPGKGVSDALEAFRVAVAEGLDAKLQFMGKWSNASYRAECESFVARHLLSDRVEFLGVLSGKDKFERFAACDIFCFPSYYDAETFGLVLLEAMQFAKPVISTIWRGIPSVVADARSGYLVPIRQPRAVADKLLLLGGDGELRRSMGQEGRRIFEREFTLEAFHRSMESEFVGLFEKP
ncbi:MAG: glycosyltransferase [Flavobacteriales bacterium]|nr:glycosyltransferase [Flavobacteriales bacterium]